MKTSDKVAADGGSPAPAQLTVAELELALEAVPRVRLAHLPTPLENCTRLTSALAGPQLFVKRDDCTGLALGGNKSRYLEVILADALDEKADCIIQGASHESNYARQISAAASKLGLEAHLVLRPPPDVTAPQGNHLLDLILGAQIHWIEPSETIVHAKEALGERLIAAGKRPYIVGMGAPKSRVLSAVSYLRMVLELVTSTHFSVSAPPDYLYVTSSSATQAGCVAAVRLLGMNTRVVGINPAGPGDEAYLSPAGLAALAVEAAAWIGQSITVTEAEIENCVDFRGPSFGQISARALEATSLMARTEGILLDPVYSAKGFSGLVHDIRAGRFRQDDQIVFLHTGGLPSLFLSTTGIQESLPYGRVGAAIDD